MKWNDDWDYDDWDDDYDEDYDKDEDLDEEDGDGNTAEGLKSEIVSTVEDLVAKVPDGDIRELLEQFARKHIDLRNILAIRYKDDINEDDLSKIRLELNEIRVSYTDGYYATVVSPEYPKELNDFLYKYMKETLEEGKYKAANEIIIAVYDKIGRYGGSDYSGAFRELMDKCLDYWRDIERNCSLEFRLEMMVRLRNVGFRDRRFREYNNEILDFIDAKFQDKECLERKLQWVEKEIANWENEQHGNKSFRNLNLGTHVVDKLDLMVRLGCSQTELDAESAKYWQLPDVRLWVEDRLESQGRLDDAVTVLQESRYLDCDEERPLVATETGMLIRLYGKTGQAEDCKRELAYYIFDCRHSHYWMDQGPSTFDYVMQLKAACGPDEWAEYRERILQRGDIVNKYELLDEEGMYSRMLDEILQENSITCMNRYEDKLKPLFPEQLKKFYTDFVIKAMPDCNGRDAYATMAGYLKKLSTYPGGQEQATDIARQWRDDFPRRRAMKEELSKAGF